MIDSRAATGGRPYGIHGNDIERRGEKFFAPAEP